MEEWSIRIKGYISSLGKALREAKANAKQVKEVEEILKLSELYLEDAKYYFNVGDHLTSALCVAYAEGLIDALRLLGLTDFNWEKPRVLKVFVAGTFDIVHPGHIYFLNRAYEFGLPYVVVSRDENVLRYKERLPLLSEQDRLLVVNSLKPVYRALLGDRVDRLKPIVDIKPDLILLGPDQPVDEDHLAKELERRGLAGVRILRLKERLNEYSSTRLIKKAAELGKYLLGE